MVDEFTVSLDSINMYDNTYQYRVTKQNQEHIERLMENMGAHGQTTPIEVTDGAKGYTIVAGFHRVCAAAQMKWKSLRAVYKENPSIADAVDANRHFAQPHTNADLKCAAKKLYNEGYNFNQIAKILWPDAGYERGSYTWKGDSKVRKWLKGNPEHKIKRDKARTSAGKIFSNGDVTEFIDHLEEYGKVQPLCQELNKRGHIEMTEQQPVVQPIKHEIGRSNFEMAHVVVIGDVHDAPGLSKNRLNWIGQYIAEAKPDKVIQIGDFANLDSMCKYPPQSFDDMESRPMFVEEELDSLDEALKALNEGLGDFDPSRHVTFGNHEARLFSGAQRAQEQRAGFGSLAYKIYADTLEKYGWSFSEYGDIHFVEGVGFVHVPLTKMGKPYGGKTAERQIAAQSNFDIVMGHSHEYKLISEAKIGGDWTRVLNVGCCLPENHVEEYAKHSNHGWSYGIVELSIRDGHIKDHSFTTMEVLEANYGDG